jgi:hypothetical protein
MPHYILIGPNIKDIYIMKIILDEKVCHSAAHRQEVQPLRPL